MLLYQISELDRILLLTLLYYINLEMNYFLNRVNCWFNLVRFIYFWRSVNTAALLILHHGLVVCLVSTEARKENFDMLYRFFIVDSRDTICNDDYFIIFLKFFIIIAMFMPSQSVWFWLKLKGFKIKLFLLLSHFCCILSKMRHNGAIVYLFVNFYFITLQSSI